MGPVSGAEQKVLVHGQNGQYTQTDYVAQPDYHFEYGVQDPKTMVHQSRQETRHGDTVQGEYRCYNLICALQKKIHLCIVFSQEQSTTIFVKTLE